MSKVVPSICHPEKPAKCKGLCKACYMRAYRNGGILPSTPARKRNQIPLCHPDQPYKGRGLCEKCYDKERWERERPEGAERRVYGVNYAKTPTCHPDRPHYGRGLCKSCHDQLPEMQKYNQEYRQENSQRDRLKHYYGLSLEEYNAMVAKQNGLCAICGQPPRGKMKRLSVDHDHATNKVRGLLCITCNRSLGYLENAQWVTPAQTYLSKHDRFYHSEFEKGWRIGLVTGVAKGYFDWQFQHEPKTEQNYIQSAGVCFFADNSYVADQYWLRYTNKQLPSGNFFRPGDFDILVHQPQKD